MRAMADRYTEAGSLECSATNESQSAAMSSVRDDGTSRWRTTRRARRWSSENVRRSVTRATVRDYSAVAVGTIKRPPSIAFAGKRY